jgi:FkbM family methyltransferase
MNDPDFPVSLVTKPGNKSVVQAGGHMGVWPLHFSKIFGKVYTFEPETPVFEALMKNVGCVLNIYAYNVALGDKDRMANFRSWSWRTAVSGMEEVGAKGSEVRQLRVLPLDDYADVMKDVALIYLDVEGFEPAIIRGAHKLINRDRPLVVCEMLAKSADKIREELTRLGYFPIKNQMNPKCRDQTFMHRDDKRYEKCTR